MYEHIECHRCDSHNCFGCNTFTLTEMFHKGKFDCLLDEHNCINSSADVAVVKHGRWILREDGYHCSNCDIQAIYTGVKLNYCPNCGAKMEVDNG